MTQKMFHVEHIKNHLNALFVVLIVFFSSCSEPEPDLSCSDFREGYFDYKGVLLVDTKIYRKGDIQYEWSDLLGVRDSFSVEWTSPCSYRITFLGGTLGDVYRQGDFLDAEIVKIQGRKYQYKATGDFLEGPFYGWIEKLPDEEAN